MAENLMDMYFDKLNKEGNAGSILASYYWALFDLQYNQKDIIMFSSLVKLYGRFEVFSAISDMYGMENLTHGNIYALVKYFCNKRKEEKYKIDLNISNDSLEDYAKEFYSKLEKVKKHPLQIRSPLDE
jgi:hypothetical protein